MKPRVQSHSKRRATIGETSNIHKEIDNNNKCTHTPKKRRSWIGLIKRINFLSPNPPHMNERKNNKEKDEKYIGKISISTFHSTAEQNTQNHHGTTNQKNTTNQKQQQKGQNANFLSATNASSQQQHQQQRKSLNSSINAKLFSPISQTAHSRFNASTASPIKQSKNADNHNTATGTGTSTSTGMDKIKMTDKEKMASRRRSLDINEIVIASRFHLMSKLGKGSFGVAYKSLDLLTNTHIAIKLERKRDGDGKKKQKKSNINTREIAILDRLNGCHRVPQLIWHGQYKQYRVMALELQGMNLSDLYEANGKHFSLKTIIYILIECILCIEAIHSRGIVHRDIKPQNFIISADANSNKIHVIDFGLSSWFVNSVQEHIEYNENCSPVGTARYASINNHRGIHQTRRDDLESIGYMICFFMKGSLPWQGLREAGRVRKWRKIEQKKSSVSNHSLTQGLPMEFCYYLDNVKKLKYDERPEYRKLINVFKKLYVKQGYVVNATEEERNDAEFYKKVNVAKDIIPDWKSKCN